MVAVTDTDRNEATVTWHKKLLKKKKSVDLKIYNKEMALGKTILKISYKKNCDWATANKTYILQYDYKKTRRCWIFWLHDSLRKIWFFMVEKWPWIKILCWIIEQQNIKINKKITMRRGARKILIRDESAIWSFAINTIDTTKLGE